MTATRSLKLDRLTAHTGVDVTMESKTLTLSRSCCGVKRQDFSPATATAKASNFSVTVSVGWNAVTSRGAFVPLQTVTIVSLPWWMLRYALAFVSLLQRYL
jgi:hypothetical protein